MRVIARGTAGGRDYYYLITTTTTTTTTTKTTTTTTITAVAGSIAVADMHSMAAVGYDLFRSA